jgi:hypothetical protein
VNRPELTYEEFSEIPFKYVFGMTGDVCAARRYVNEEHGLVKEVVTKRKKSGDIYSGWKTPEVCFFMTDDPLDVWYPNGAMLYEAYMHKVCGVPYDGLA